MRASHTLGIFSRFIGATRSQVVVYGIRWIGWFWLIKHTRPSMGFLESREHPVRGITKKFLGKSEQETFLCPQQYPLKD
jgi:hypothetical protein